MRKDPREGDAIIAIGLTIALAAMPGCGTTKMSGTSRTATEQILLTNAWDDALHKIDFRPMAGVPVYLDTQYVNAVDQGWVISSIRQAMLSQGVLLRQKAEHAQWIVEARVGAYGTDSYSWLVGVPQVTVPQTITGVPAGTLPEIPLVKKSEQYGQAKLALFAYERASGRVVWESGTSMATADAKDVYVGGAGPFQSGSIRNRKKRIGVNIPMLSDPGAAQDPGRQRLKNNLPSMPLPPSASDLESFAP